MGLPLDFFPPRIVPADTFRRVFALYGTCNLRRWFIFNFLWRFKSRNVKKPLRFTNDFDNKDDIILRDHLAMERTKLANERTLLAYMRTTLYLLLAGLGLLGLHDFAQMRWVGYLVLAASAVVMVIGIWRFLELRKQLRKYY